MSWISNSLKFAEDLLEAADRKAETSLVEDEDGNLVDPRTPQKPAPRERYVSRKERRTGDVALGAGAALKRETRELNAELDELDGRMLAAQRDMDAMSARESKLQRRLEEEETAFAQTRKHLDTMARQLADTDVKAAAALREELAAAQKRVEQLEAEADAARAAHTHALSNVRRELRVAEVRASDAQRDAAAALASAQRREDELVAERAELTAALAQAQAALDDKASAMHDLSSTAGNAETEAHLRREAAAAAEAAVLAERRSNTQLRREVRELAGQLAAAKAEAATAKGAAEEARRDADRRVAALSSELAAAKAQGGAAKVADLEARLQTLAESVVQRQGLLDQARSERATLQQALERERRRRKDAEAAAANPFGDDNGVNGAVRARGGSNAGADDPEMGYSASGNGGLTRRRLGMGAMGSPAMSTLQPIARLRNRRVEHAVDVVDRFTLKTGFILRTNAMARLLFLCYLVLLHLWALFILVFHTHSLDHADGIGGHGAAGVRIPGQEPTGGAFPGGAPPARVPRASTVGVP